MVKGTSHCKKNLSRHNMILTISLLSGKFSYQNHSNNTCNPFHHRLVMEQYVIQPRIKY